MCYVFHRSSWSLLHCPCSPTGPGGPGRPGLPGGPSIPFGPGIPGVPVKYRHFNQIMNKTDFSADLEMLQSEMPWVTNELILPRYCLCSFCRFTVGQGDELESKECTETKHTGTTALTATLKPPLNWRVLVAKDTVIQQLPFYRQMFLLDNRLKALWTGIE